jgi:hypothetical protein
VVDERPRLPASEIEKLLLDALRRLPTLRNTQSVTIRPYSGPKGWSWELDSPGRWKQTPEAPDDLLWILGRADKLSDVRNDAIHALVLLHIGLETVEMNVASPPGASANENCSTTLRRVRSSSTISPNARVMSTRSTPSLGGPLARSPSLTGGSGRPRGHRKHGKRLA